MRLHSLAGRFNPAGGFIRAWNKKNGNNMTGWIIIDCLMNLPLLYFAAEELSDPLRFFFIGHRKGGMARTAVGEKEGGLRKARFFSVGIVQYINIHIL